MNKYDLLTYIVVGFALSNLLVLPIAILHDGEYDNILFYTPLMTGIPTVFFAVWFLTYSNKHKVTEDT